MNNPQQQQPHNNQQNEPPMVQLADNILELGDKIKLGTQQAVQRLEMLTQQVREYGDGFARYIEAYSNLIHETNETAEHLARRIAENTPPAMRPAPQQQQQ